MNNVHKVITAALLTPMSGGRWGLPVLFWGDPGSAKSALIEEVAASAGLPCEVLSPSERGEGAFGCVPVPQTVNGRTLLTYPAPDWTEKMTSRGVVFVDEVTTAPPMLQAPMLGLIGARRIGSTTLPLGCRVIGAANETDDAANGHDLASPLANRFVHLPWPNLSVSAHTSYMSRAGMSGHTSEASDAGESSPADACAREAAVLAAWGAAWARGVQMEAGFLHAQPSFKNRKPRANSAKASNAWPSDRSWELAVRSLVTAQVHELDTLDAELLVCGAIGNEAAEQWAAYRESADLPNVADVLDGVTRFDPKASRADVLAAVLAGATALVSPKSCALRNARAEALWALFAAVPTKYRDFIVEPVRSLTAPAVSLQTVKGATPVLASLRGFGDALKAGKLWPQTTARKRPSCWRRGG